MSQHIFTAWGSIIPIQTLSIITSNEVENPTEVENRKNFYDGFCQWYGDSKNLPADWVKWRIKPGEPIQHEDPVFENSIDHAETNFEAYEDETDGKAHEIPEVDDISDLDLFLNA